MQLKTFLKSFTTKDQSQKELKLSEHKKYNLYALPSGFSGCAWWRYRLPFGKLKKLGSDKLNITLGEGNTISREEVATINKSSDIVSIQAPGHWNGYYLMKTHQSEGKKVILDYDDYSFDLSPQNPRYSDLGTREYQEFDEKGNVKFSWRDMENRFDLKSNIEKYKAFEKSISEADLVTTTTKYIADKFSKFNRRVDILPNSVDMDLWKPISRPEKYNNEIRIGWFGGDSHYDDLKLFKNLLPELVKKYPNVKIVIQAPLVPFWRECFELIPQDKLEWRNWVGLELYTIMLANRHFDIGLCPLADNEFNKCKSSIKWMELAALGVPSVCQKIVPYSETVSDKVDGFLATDEKDWFDKVSALVESTDLRKKIADNAFNEVKKNHNLDINCRIWESVYFSCAEGKYVGKN